jgi:two-component system, LytTR family, response regulator
VTRRIVIVDDEALARDRLRDLIAEHEGFTVVAECDRGEAAVNAIGTLDPDIVFLDVRMPGLDGFDVLDAALDVVPAEKMPVVVFVTAYDDYAVRAFETNALDYLQKPVARPRLTQSLDRARRQLELREAHATIASQNETGTDLPQSAALRFARQASRGYPTRFAARHGDVVYFVRAAAIDWIDAAGNYVRLHTGGTTHLLRSTISDLETRLDPRHFVRVHRSTIVNLDRVTRIEPFTHGEYILILSDGARVRSSRGYSARLREFVHSGME